MTVRHMDQEPHDIGVGDCVDAMWMFCRNGETVEGGL